MKGISNTIKEFSNDYYDLYNSYKYVVEEDAEGINLKYMEYNETKKGLEELESISINFNVAERLFSEVSNAIKTGEFKLNSII